MKESGEEGDPLVKKTGTPAGGVLYSRQPEQATQAVGVSTRVRELEASRCPRCTCNLHWKSEGCSPGQSRRFKHDIQAMNSTAGVGARHRAVLVL